MLEKIQNLPEGVDGLEAVGTITREDYEKIVSPLMEEHRKDKRKVRFLYWFGPRFQSFSVGAAWDDFRIGTKYLRLFERCAVVTEVKWVKYAALLFGSVLPCPVRVFKNDELPLAKEWVSAS